MNTSTLHPHHITSHQYLTSHHFTYMTGVTMFTRGLDDYYITVLYLCYAATLYLILADLGIHSLTAPPRQAIARASKYFRSDSPIPIAGSGFKLSFPLFPRNWSLPFRLSLTQSYICSRNLKGLSDLSA